MAPPDETPPVDGEPPPPPPPPPPPTEGEPPPPPSTPPIVDIQNPVYVPQVYAPLAPKYDRAKQTATVQSDGTFLFTDQLVGFEPVNSTNAVAMLAYLAEASIGEWELGYLSEFSQSHLGVSATRTVDTHHNSDGTTALDGVTRIGENTQVVVSLVHRSNTGVCVGGSPVVTSSKAAAFGDVAKATAPCAIALGYRVVADRVGGTSLGTKGVGMLGVEIAGHQENKFVMGAQSADWATSQKLTNNARGLSDGNYKGTGLVSVRAIVCANYIGLEEGTPTMSPPSDIVLFDVTAVLFVVGGVVVQVLSNQVVQTFAGANSAGYAVTVNEVGDLFLEAVSPTGASRAIAFVTITDLTQSVYN